LPARTPHDPPSPGPLLAGPAPLPPATQRKRSRGRALVYSLAAPLIYFVSRALWWTCRVRVEGSEQLDAALRDHPACIPTVWHEQLVGATGFLVDSFRERERALAFLVSPSVDGDLVERVVLRARGLVVRGSASRSGVKALRDLYRLMRKQGASPLFAPDGPTGPARSCKSGAVLLSQLSGMPILPIAVAARGALRLPTWDSLRVPLPFTRVVVHIGAPRVVPAAAAEERLEVERSGLEEELERLRHAAGDRT
jgi:lysophospholipid acyltransferase (LPLAT)-like uncharacterized protein